MKSILTKVISIVVLLAFISSSIGLEYAYALRAPSTESVSHFAEKLKKAITTGFIEDSELQPAPARFAEKDVTAASADELMDLIEPGNPSATRIAAARELMRIQYTKAANRLYSLTAAESIPDEVKQTFLVATHKLKSSLASKLPEGDRREPLSRESRFAEEPNKDVGYLVTEKGERLLMRVGARTDEGLARTDREMTLEFYTADYTAIGHIKAITRDNSVSITQLHVSPMFSQRDYYPIILEAFLRDAREAGLTGKEIRSFSAYVLNPLIANLLLQLGFKIAVDEEGRIPSSAVHVAMDIAEREDQRIPICIALAKPGKERYQVQALRELIETDTDGCGIFEISDAVVGGAGGAIFVTYVSGEKEGNLEALDLTLNEPQAKIFFGDTKQPIFQPLDIQRDDRPVMTTSVEEIRAGAPAKRFSGVIRGFVDGIRRAAEDGTGLTHLLSDLASLEDRIRKNAARLAAVEEAQDARAGAVRAIVAAHEKELFEIALEAHLKAREAELFDDSLTERIIIDLIDDRHHITVSNETARDLNRLGFSRFAEGGDDALTPEEIRAVVQRLGSGDPGDVIWRLCHSIGEPAIPELTYYLCRGDIDFDARSKAAFALEQIGEASVFPLSEIMQDSTIFEEAKWFAINTLEKISVELEKNKRQLPLVAIHALTVAEKDDYKLIRDSASKVLAAARRLFGDEYLQMAAYVEDIEKGEGVKAATDELIKMGEKPILPMVVHIAHAIDDEDAGDRVATAMQTIALAYEGEVSAEVSRGLYMLTSDPKRKEIAPLVLGAAPCFLPTLIDTAGKEQDSESVEDAKALVLKVVNEENELGLLKRTITRLLERSIAEGGSPYIKEWARRALQLLDSKGIDILMGCFKESDDLNLRSEVMGIFKMLAVSDEFRSSGPAAIAKLSEMTRLHDLDRASDSQLPAFREEAQIFLRAKIYTGDKTDLDDPFLRIPGSPPKRGGKSHFAEAEQEGPTEGELGKLAENLMQDPTWEVRRRFMQIGEPAIPTLVSVVRSNREFKAKERAIKVLGRIEGAAILPLAEIMQDEGLDEEVRICAGNELEGLNRVLLAAGHVFPGEAIKILQGVTKDANPEIAGFASRTLEYLGAEHIEIAEGIGEYALSGNRDSLTKLAEKGEIVIVPIINRIAAGSLKPDIQEGFTSTARGIAVECGDKEEISSRTSRGLCSYLKEDKPGYKKIRPFVRKEVVTYLLPALTRTAKHAREECVRESGRLILMFLKGSNILLPSEIVVDLVNLIGKDADAEVRKRAEILVKGLEPPEIANLMKVFRQSDNKSFQLNVIEALSMVERSFDGFTDALEGLKEITEIPGLDEDLQAVAESAAEQKAAEYFADVDFGTGKPKLPGLPPSGPDRFAEAAPLAATYMDVINQAEAIAASGDMFYVVASEGDDEYLVAGGDERRILESLGINIARKTVGTGKESLEFAVHIINDLKDNSEVKDAQIGILLFAPAAKIISWRKQLEELTKDCDNIKVFLAQNPPRVDPRKTDIPKISLFKTIQQWRQAIRKTLQETVFLPETTPQPQDVWDQFESIIETYLKELEERKELEIGT